MQSLVNQIAVRLRDEFGLDNRQYLAVETILYRLTDHKPTHSHDNAEHWVRSLLAEMTNR